MFLPTGKVLGATNNKCSFSYCAAEYHEVSSLIGVMIDRLNRYQRCNLTEGIRERGKKMMLEMALYAVILPP